MTSEPFGHAVCQYISEDPDIFIGAEVTGSGQRIAHTLYARLKVEPGDRGVVVSVGKYPQRPAPLAQVLLKKTGRCAGKIPDGVYPDSGKLSACGWPHIYHIACRQTP